MSIPLLMHFSEYQLAGPCGCVSHDGRALVLMPSLLLEQRSLLRVEEIERPAEDAALHLSAYEGVASFDEHVMEPPHKPVGTTPVIEIVVETQPYSRLII